MPKSGSGEECCSNPGLGDDAEEERINICIIGAALYSSAFELIESTRDFELVELHEMPLEVLNTPRVPQRHRCP